MAYKPCVLILDINTDDYALLIYNDVKSAESYYLGLYKTTEEFKAYGRKCNYAEALAAYEEFLKDYFGAASGFIDYVDKSIFEDKVLWGKPRKVCCIDGVKYLIVNSEAVKVNI